METLSEATWDVAICGTGLYQCLLALALSRSGKRILHLDPNNYYGGPEAALSLEEADAWVAANSQAAVEPRLFANAAVTKSDHENNLSFSRAYSLALAPHIIPARSRLLSHLVSSRAYRQLEFQAVGSFYAFRPPSSAAREKPSLVRIPSTREDVFSTAIVPARSKRQLIKFLKFVLHHDDEEHLDAWKPHADLALSDFLRSSFKLDDDLGKYMVALTLRLDGPTVSTQDGLAILQLFLKSMGMFGPGFAAVYPKWGGSGEISQVACRAQAVGGGVYMLGMGIKATAPEEKGTTEFELFNGIKVKTRLLVQGGDQSVKTGAPWAHRLIAIVSSPLSSLFEAAVEGSPTPAVAIVTFSDGSVPTSDGTTYPHPVFALVNSSETGECPAGQCIIYLSTFSTAAASEALDWCLSSLLDAATAPKNEAEEQEKAAILYKLSYDQYAGGCEPPLVDGNILTFPPPPATLLFQDSCLDWVRTAWEKAIGAVSAATGQDSGVVSFMEFEDREPLSDDDNGGE